MVDSLIIAILVMAIIVIVTMVYGVWYILVYSII